MTITTVNPLRDENWDANLDAFSESSVFHRTAWLRVLHDTYGFTPCYIHGTDTNGERAVLPMIEVDSWLTGKRGVSLPFTDESAVLGGHESELFDAAVALGRQRKWQRIELRTGTNLQRGGRAKAPSEPIFPPESEFLKEARFGEDVSPCPKPSVRFYGHRLELQPHPKELFAKCDASTRRAVRKAEQSGVQIEFSRGLDAMRAFYQLLRKTRQRHGAPPQPFSFFLKLQRHVLETGHGWIVLARSSGVPIAGAVFLHSQRNAIYKYGASDECHQHLRANNLVMWRAIEWYAQNNFKFLDFGRTSLGNQGLRRFKLGWGATERMVNYFQYDLRTNSFEVSRDDAAGWHTHIFRRLPLWASQLIGTLLYKHTA